MSLADPSREARSVNVVSDSVFTVKGHGVHSAFVDQVEALRARANWIVKINAVNGFKVLHLHTLGPLAQYHLLAARVPVVLTAHIMPDSLVGSLVGGASLHRCSTAFLRYCYNRADVLVAVNPAQVAQLRAMGVNSRIVVVPNCVTPVMVQRVDKAAARALLGLGDGPLVLSVGQIQKRKCYADVLAAAAMCPQTSFVWVGGQPFGPLTSGFVASMRDRRTATRNIKFVGPLSRDSIALYYMASDVFFHPSFHELSSVAVLEAAAFGLPIVVRASELHESLYGQNVVQADRGSYLAILEDLCTQGRERRQAIEGSERLVECFGWERMARELENIYLQLTT